MSVFYASHHYRHMRFSVIIPIFNVAKFIERGLNSLQNQTFQDFEIILVDDGSTDGSGKLCDKAAQHDNRIKVLHKKNSGSGPARNAGIEIAQGEFILFFDIDDLLDPEAFDVINHNLLSANPDILIFSYREVNPFYKTSSEYVFESVHYESNQDLREGWVSNLSGVKFNNGFVWNKAYRRDFLNNNNIRFESLRIQQDEVFNLLAYRYAENVYVINDILYIYYVYHQGNTANHIIPERLEIFIRVYEAYRELMAYWSINDSKLDEYINKRLFLGLITHISKDIYNNKLPHFNDKTELGHLFDFDVIRSVAATIDSTKLTFIQRYYHRAVKANNPRGFKLTMIMDKSYVLLKRRLRQLTKQ